MLEGLEVEVMFDDQVHERHKFKVNIQGEDYMGILHNGEVQWFQPQPRDKVGDEQVDAVESAVQQFMMNNVDHFS